MNKSVLQLNGWQVTGIAWALQQEELPIRGGIIADDCGRGKTIITLTVILERAQQDGASGPWKATIVLVPPPRGQRLGRRSPVFFASELGIWRFYGTADKITRRRMEARTIPSTTKTLARRAFP